MEKLKRSLRPWQAIPLLAAVTVAGALFITNALSLQGPEPPSSSRTFKIVFEEIGTDEGPQIKYDVLPFDMADGWDFEERDGYECANVARYDESGELLLLLDFEQSRNYIHGNGGGTFRINDRGGVEAGDGPNTNSLPHRPCGSEPVQPTGPHADHLPSRWSPSGEDHFPHMTEHADRATHGVRIYLDGALDSVATDTLNDMLFNGDCDRAYWTPGDEPREFVLWWDKDFPENGHMDGTQPLDCGGGGNEPVAVARAYFAFLAPNMGVCILDHDVLGGQRCAGLVAEPSPTPTPTETESPSPTETESPSPTETESPSPTETPSPTPTVVCYDGMLSSNDGVSKYFRVCE